MKNENTIRRPTLARSPNVSRTVAMNNKKSTIIGLNTAFIVVSTTAIVSRLLIRVFLIRSIGADDFLITIALVLALTHASLCIVLTNYGEGLHMQYEQPSDIPTYTTILLILGLLYNLCQMFIKLSYLTLYLRHAITTAAKSVVYFLMALVSAFGIATSITSMALCIPNEKLWTPDLPGRCINIKAYYISATALNIFFDLIIFILPIPTLWTLRLPKSQRIGLVGVFGVGLIVIIASIFRLQTTVSLLDTPAYLTDNTWDTVNTLDWSAVEIHVALLVSCTAAFKALIQRYFPRLLGRPSRTWTYGASHSTT